MAAIAIERVGVRERIKRFTEQHPRIAWGSLYAGSAVALAAGLAFNFGYAIPRENSNYSQVDGMTFKKDFVDLGLARRNWVHVKPVDRAKRAEVEIILKQEMGYKDIKVVKEMGSSVTYSVSSK